MNPIRTRRLRGHLAQALTDTGGAQDLLRHAVLAMDSDLPPDPELLLAGLRVAFCRADNLFFLLDRLDDAHIVLSAAECGAGAEVELGGLLGAIRRHGRPA